MSQSHTDNIFKNMKDVRFEQTISVQCGVTMNDSVEARVIAEVMSEKPDVTVTYMPAMIRIDGNGKISTSTHYGRMVMVDDNTVVLFGNMDDVKEFI
jgi:propane monooxygenase coupling protein